MESARRKVENHEPAPAGDRYGATVSVLTATGRI